MNKYDPKRPEVRLYAALNNYDPSDIRETACLLLFFDGHDLSALGAEHERIVAERLAADTAERDAAIVERDHLRKLVRESLNVLNCATLSEHASHAGHTHASERYGKIAQEYVTAARAALEQSK